METEITKIEIENKEKIAYERGLLEGRQEIGMFAIIPVSILENENLSANSKLLYGEIMALSKKSGQCYATNEYLANMLGLKKESMPQLLKELSGMGLIIVNINRSSKGTYRDIVVSFFNEGGHKSITRGGRAKQRGGASLDNEDKREIDKVDINKIDTNSATAVAEPINKFIELFKNVNPSYKQLYKDKTQRACLERLLKLMGVEKLENCINTLARTNGMEFAPVITTPYLLEKKLGDLIVFVKKQRINKNKIAIL